jgi:ABC-type uncharacterized transport system involved in gliding motility auxiliary subunit
VPRSPLLDMIQAYGVSVGSDMVLDTSARDYRLPQQKPSGEIAWETIGRYPPWVSIQAANVSASHPVTAHFTGLDLLWPVALSAVPRNGVEETPLVTSSASSWIQEPPFVIDPYRVAQSGAQPGRSTLAYALSGSFPSAFGAPGAPSRPTRMLVVGDSDFASDLMQFSNSLPNVFFIENAILWLSGNADLLSIKTRAGAEGKLDRIPDPGTRARLMVAAPVLNVVVIPLIVLVLGIVGRLRRREGKQQ